MSENRGNKTRTGLVQHLFFKCDEMSLRWVFTIKTAFILLKGIFEFVFLIECDQLYRRRAGGSSREKPFNNLLSLRS